MMRLYNFKKGDKVPQWIEHTECEEGFEAFVTFGTDVVVERRKKTDNFPARVFPKNEIVKGEGIILLSTIPKGGEILVKGAPTSVHEHPRGCYVGKDYSNTEIKKFTIDSTALPSPPITKLSKAAYCSEKIE